MAAASASPAASSRSMPSCCTAAGSAGGRGCEHRPTHRLRCHHAAVTAALAGGTAALRTSAPSCSSSSSGSMLSSSGPSAPGLPIRAMMSCTAAAVAQGMFAFTSTATARARNGTAFCAPPLSAAPLSIAPPSAAPPPAPPAAALPPTHLQRLDARIRQLVLVQRQQLQARLALAGLGQRGRAAPPQLVLARVQVRQLPQAHQRLQR